MIICHFAFASRIRFFINAVIRNGSKIANNHICQGKVLNLQKRSFTLKILQIFSHCLISMIDYQWGRSGVFVV